MNNKENLDKNFISAVIYMNTADSLDGLKAFIENLSSYMKLFKLKVYIKSVVQNLKKKNI